MIDFTLIQHAGIEAREVLVQVQFGLCGAIDDVGSGLKTTR